MSTKTKDTKSLFKKCRVHEPPSWAKELNLVICRTAGNYVAHYKKQHKQQDLTYPCLSILYTLLENNGKISQKRLSKKLPVTKQAITNSLKLLEKRGLIRKKMINNDRRKRQIQLTNEGISFFDFSLPLREQFYIKLTDLVSKYEARIIIDTLDKLNKFYEKEIRELSKAQSKSVDVSEECPIAALSK